jgi:hypothetical protein
LVGSPPAAMQLLNRSDNLAPQLAGFAVAANQQFLDAAFSVVGRWDPVLVDEKLGGAADVWREMSKSRSKKLGFRSNELVWSSVGA